MRKSNGKRWTEITVICSVTCGYFSRVAPTSLDAHETKRKEMKLVVEAEMVDLT